MQTPEKSIRVRGAREHNLKNLSVEIPRDKLVVITGVSGSGKSSLAFDTIFAEGQRKYMESLSAYARQFLDQMQKPNVEAIEGLPPTIAIEQRSGGHSPRSIVATTTEIWDYLRLLYARCGTPTCWHSEETGKGKSKSVRCCGKEISASNPSLIVETRRVVTRARTPPKCWGCRSTRSISLHRRPPLSRPRTACARRTSTTIPRLARADRTRTRTSRMPVAMLRPSAHLRP
jgi:hypothetical protein